MEKAIKLMAMLLSAVTMAIGMTSCETTPKNVQQAAATETRKVVDFTTVDGTKMGIEGTVWTYTEPLTYATRSHVWMRLEFKGSKAYLYSASPSKGAWGNASGKNYIVKESRDGRTGERQVVVEIGGEYIKFVPKTGMLDYFGIQSCIMKQRDYSWD